MITIKTPAEIKMLRVGGRLLAGVLRQVSEAVKPGVTTGELESLACRLISEAGGRPSFKGYKQGHDSEPFPTALCTSINDEIVHAPALPPRTLTSGDIISLDIGMEYPWKGEGKGLFTDMAITVGVGEISQDAKKLIAVTREALRRGIAAVKSDNSLEDIGRSIEDYVRANKFSVVRDLVGHGVGYAVHEEPSVPNFSFKNTGLKNYKLKKDLVLALEPMVNLGQAAVSFNPNGHTIRTADGSLSAHFEHTIAVTADGVLVLTAD